MTADHDDLTPLRDRSWAALSHRQALAELVLLGWTPCGVARESTPDEIHALRAAWTAGA
ncbi:hypothetical protein ACQP25_02545 [Microtetraspora malaysiensis]|uniref:hypothetical protein n=1 Tax=Microtetraspora malaysiensis TaxID=161358 RepID=UPI003D91AC1D